MSCFSLVRGLVLVGMIVGAVSQIGGCDEITTQIRAVCDDPIGPPQHPWARELQDRQWGAEVEKAMREAANLEITPDRGL